MLLRLQLRSVGHPVGIKIKVKLVFAPSWRYLGGSSDGTYGLSDSASFDRSADQSHCFGHINVH